MHRQVEESVLPVCEELGIGFVPYSPLNRGFLGGMINEYTAFDPTNDNRQTLPRLSVEIISSCLFSEFLKDLDWVKSSFLEVIKKVLFLTTVCKLVVFFFLSILIILVPILSNLIFDSKILAGDEFKFNTVI